MPFAYINTTNHIILTSTIINKFNFTFTNEKENNTPMYAFKWQCKSGVSGFLCLSY